MNVSASARTAPAALVPRPSSDTAATTQVLAAEPTAATPPAAPKSWDTPPPMTLKPGVSYTANIATTDGQLAVQLLPGAAPNAVNNFVFLANQGFYKHVPIHRVVQDFMFQSGDPTGTGAGGPGYSIPDDPVPASFPRTKMFVKEIPPKGEWRTTSYTAGILAMANAGPNTGGSQFFVMLDKYALPDDYSIFGQVTEGAEVLAKINARTVVDNGSGELSKPVEPIFVEDVTVTETPVTAPTG